jgi:tRNA pseudouridine55 synthase
LSAGAEEGTGGRRPSRAPRPRIAWRRVDGVLLLDKPVGISSNHALQQVRRKLRAERGGHTGTLDPLASGLLPLAFGEATKFSQGLLDADKAYVATVRLGERTSTGDAEGEVVDRRPVLIDDATLQAALPRFTGEIEQVPPMHSALKRDGVALYTLARRGETVERAPRRVTIHALAAGPLEGHEFSLSVRCSKGTYVRQLAEDLGEALGCGAHLRSLRRTAVGPLSLETAHPLDAIDAASEDVARSMLLPVDCLLPAELPAVRLAGTARAQFLQGQAPVAPAGAAGACRVYGPSGDFLGLGFQRPDGRVQPSRVVAATSPDSPH